MKVATVPEYMEPKNEIQELFRHAMGSLVSTVTVVTCVHDGLDHAMTASAVSSVSMDPPIILVCVNRSARFWSAINQADHWAVSVLSQGGRTHANWLANPGRPLEGQLDQVPHSRTQNGNAVLDDSLSRLECTTFEQIHAGDHDVFLGEVHWAERGSGHDPLLYWRSQYRHMGDRTES